MMHTYHHAHAEANHILAAYLRLTFLFLFLYFISIAFSLCGRRCVRARSTSRGLLAVVLSRFVNISLCLVSLVLTF